MFMYLCFFTCVFLYRTLLKKQKKLSFRDRVGDFWSEQESALYLLGVVLGSDQ